MIKYAYKLLNLSESDVILDGIYLNEKENKNKNKSHTNATKKQCYFYRWILFCLQMNYTDVNSN